MSLKVTLGLLGFCGDARYVCLRQKQSSHLYVGLCFARHRNTRRNNYTRELYVKTKTINKGKSPLQHWQNFLSDLTTPRPSPKPRGKTQWDTHSSVLLGPPSISRTFFTRLNPQLFDNRYNNHDSGDEIMALITRDSGEKQGTRTLPGGGVDIPKCSRPWSSAYKTLISQKRPNHLSKSVSRWNLNMFSKYINFPDHVEELVIDTSNVDQTEEMDKVVQKTLNMFYTSKTNPILENVLSTEEDVRIFLSAILRHICNKLKFGLKTEARVELNYLPKCKFDFLFYTSDGKPIGCLETKSPSAMNNNAFAQAVIELLILQQLACRHGIDISVVPLFNILTDGQRYVLMQVQGEKLCLESHMARNGNYVLKIRTTEVLESLFKMFEMTLNCKP